jgi:hypothetical protein
MGIIFDSPMSTSSSLALRSSSSKRQVGSTCESIEYTTQARLETGVRCRWRWGCLAIWVDVGCSVYTCVCVSCVGRSGRDWFLVIIFFLFSYWRVDIRASIRRLVSGDRWWVGPTVMRSFLIPVAVLVDNV